MRALLVVPALPVPLIPPPAALTQEVGAVSQEDSHLGSCQLSTAPPTAGTFPETLLCTIVLLVSNYWIVKCVCLTDLQESHVTRPFFFTTFKISISKSSASRVMVLISSSILLLDVKYFIL